VETYPVSKHLNHK